MWCSKLGKEYPQEEIEKNVENCKRELDRLRQLPSNRFCADCGSNGTSWASINLGVFLCGKCAAHHVSAGSDISEPKECTGAEFWGPDEIKHMESFGNAKAHEVYGGDESRPAPNASEDDWKQFLVDKYEHRKYAPHSLTVSQPLLRNRFDAEELTFFNNRMDGTIPTETSGEGDAKNDEFYAQFGM